MKTKDLEALIPITKEIINQGYTVRTIESEEKYVGRNIFQIKLIFSRERDPSADDNPYPDPHLI